MTIEEMLTNTFNDVAEQTQVDSRLDEIVAGVDPLRIKPQRRAVQVLAAAAVLLLVGSLVSMSGLWSGNDSEPVVAGRPTGPETLSVTEQAELDSLSDFHASRRESVDALVEPITTADDLMQHADAVVGKVVEVRSGSAFIDADESGSGSEANMPSREVDFDDPNAEWRTFVLKVEVEEIIDGGSRVKDYASNGQVLIGVSVPDIALATAYKHFGRAVFFVNHSPVFQGDLNTVALAHNGTLISPLGGDQLAEFPLAGPEVRRVLTVKPTLQDLRLSGVNRVARTADIEVRLETEDRAAEVADWIGEQRNVSDYTYVSQAQAFEDFQREFRGSLDLIDTVVESDMPVLFYITLNDVPEESFQSFLLELREVVPGALVEDYRDDVDADLYEAVGDGSLIGTRWDLVSVDGEAVDPAEAPSLYLYENGAYRFDTCVDLAGRAVISTVGLILDPPAARRLAECSYELIDIGRTPVVTRLTGTDLVLWGVQGQFRFVNGGPASRTLETDTLTSFDEDNAEAFQIDSRIVEPGDDVVVSWGPVPDSDLREWFTMEYIDSIGESELAFRLAGVEPGSAEEPSSVRPGEKRSSDGSVSTTIPGSTGEPQPFDPGDVIGWEVELRVPDDIWSGTYRICQTDIGCVYLIVEEAE